MANKEINRMIDNKTLWVVPLNKYNLDVSVSVELISEAIALECRKHLIGDCKDAPEDTVFHVKIDMGIGPLGASLIIEDVNEKLEEFGLLWRLRKAKTHGDYDASNWPYGLRTPYTKFTLTFVNLEDLVGIEGRNNFYVEEF